MADLLLATVNFEPWRQICYFSGTGGTNAVTCCLEFSGVVLFKQRINYKFETIAGSNSLII